MDNKETKKLCLDLMQANNCSKIIEILTAKNLWKDQSLWRNYGNKEGSWAIVNNQGNPSFALTEKITNCVDAILMNQCFEKKMHPKSNDPGLPKTPTEAVHKYFETKKEISNYNLEEKLFENDIDSVAGLQLYWDDKKARKIAENINVSVGGDGQHPNIAIVDQGEGQTPENLPNTLMSLHVGNKKSIKFAQGKWNQGGSGAIRHTGTDSGESMQFVLTKRNPNIIKNFIKEQVGKYDEWSFTILRRNPPSKGSTDVSEVVYLAPSPNNMPLSFKSDKFPIFPEKSGNQLSQFGRETESGTLVVLYEYNLSTSHALMGSASLYRRLDIQMPKLPLPVRIIETRKKFRSEKEQSLTMRGFSNFQENQYIKKKKESPLETISPRRGFIRCEDYRITYDIFCFKKGKGKTYIPSSAGLLWTVNGQTHAISNKEIFKIDKLSFNEIADDLIVVIDCTDITGRDREDFFKSSRDRLDTSFHLYKEVRDSLIDDLSQNEDLKNIIQKRIEDSLDEDEITDPKTLEDIQKLLQDLPDDEKDFLPPGFSLKKEVEKEEGSGIYNLSKKRFPSFVCFKELKKDPNAKQHIKKDIQLNQKASFNLHTDAQDDYFDRTLSPGKLSVNWIFNNKKFAPKGFNRILKNGFFKISRIVLPNNIKAGDLLDIEFLIKDKENKEGFKLTSSLIIKPTQKKTKPTKKEKKEKKKREEMLPPEGGQGINTVEEIIQNPIIAQYVTKDDWLLKCGYEWNEDEVLHVKKSKIEERTNYNLFLNKDNINLKHEIDYKQTAKNSQHLIETKYKMGISLIAMFSLMQFRRDENKKRNTVFSAEGENGEEKVIPEETIIKIATRNAGKGLFTLAKYLESLGKSISKTKISDQDE
jgi:hypothetical protein